MDTTDNTQLRPLKGVTLPTTKPSRKRRFTAPRSPRKIDPSVAEIRARAAEEVRQYHKAKASGGVLKRIMDKEVQKLTDTDREALLAYLQKYLPPTK